MFEIIVEFGGVKVHNPNSTGSQPHVGFALAVYSERPQVHLNPLGDVLSQEVRALLLREQRDHHVEDRSQDGEDLDHDVLVGLLGGHVGA